MYTASRSRAFNEFGEGRRSTIKTLLEPGGYDFCREEGAKARRLRFYAPRQTPWVVGDTFFASAGLAI